MKIALLGYGKMGHAIERIALDRGHEVVARIDIDNHADMDSPEFLSADVVIEFSSPSTAFDNYTECFKRGKKIVSGSTGWTSRLPEIKAMCDEGANTFFWTSNFSIGVNIFFAISRYVARLMEHFPQYKAYMTEVHHTHKLDHPSGTAITLAEGIIENHHGYEKWVEEPDGNESSLIVSHTREGEVPGTHIVRWDSAVDCISLEHRAKSRDGFALGAVMAAEWVNESDARGFLTMEQMMGDLL